MAKAEYPHAGHRQRLREKFLQNGAEALSETELLELLLFFSVPRVDTRPLAEALLAAFGSLDGVLSAQPEELHAQAGLNNGTDALFALVRYLQERAGHDRREEVFGNSALLKEYLPRQFAGFRKERALLFYLAKDGSVLRRQTIMSNSDGSVKLSLHSYAETACRLGASSVLLAHNHPNGRAFPSVADLEATAHLLSILRENGIELIEHYIIAGKDCYPILANRHTLSASDGLQHSDGESLR